MPEGEILYKQEAFTDAVAQQNAAAKKMRAFYDDQLVCFNKLADTWLGDGGEAYRIAAKEMASEMLTGVFMIESLANRTDTALEVMSKVDEVLADKYARNYVLR